MSGKMITPKYITKEVCEKAIDTALLAVFGSISPLHTLPKHYQCDIVVLVPAMEDARAEDYPDYPDYSITPHLIYEKNVGEKSDWEHLYDHIAKCKALQRWTGRNDGQAGVNPHLLFPGDTPYWGSVKRHGIVVACSGVQPWVDRLIAGITADVIIALAHDAYENDPQIGKKDFIS